MLNKNIRTIQNDKSGITFSVPVTLQLIEEADIPLDSQDETSQDETSQDETIEGEEIVDENTMFRIVFGVVNNLDKVCPTYTLEVYRREPGTESSHWEDAIYPRFTANCFCIPPHYWMEEVNAKLKNLVDTVTNGDAKRIMTQAHVSLYNKLRWVKS